VALFGQLQVDPGGRQADVPATAVLGQVLLVDERRRTALGSSAI